METILGLEIINGQLQPQNNANLIKTQPSAEWQQLSKSVQTRVMTALSKYGDANNFLAIYSPKNANTMVAKNGISGMFDADTPSLTIAKYAFGQKAVDSFLNIFVMDSANFYGLLNGKTDPETIASISNAIMLEYHHFKVSEIVLFFQLLKAGHFRDNNDNDRGKMYGSFNGEVIMDCLYKFKQERARHLDEVETAKRNKEREEMNKNCVPAPPGVLELIGKTIASIGNPTKRKLEDYRHIDKDHITTFRPKTAEERRTEAEHLKEFKARLDEEMANKEIQQTLNNS